MKGFEVEEGMLVAWRDTDDATNFEGYLICIVASLCINKDLVCLDVVFPRDETQEVEGVPKNELLFLSHPLAKNIEEITEEHLYRVLLSLARKLMNKKQ